jgi:hypothetical protein
MQTGRSTQGSERTDPNHLPCPWPLHLLVCSWNVSFSLSYLPRFLLISLPSQIGVHLPVIGCASVVDVFQQTYLRAHVEEGEGVTSERCM